MRDTGDVRPRFFKAFYLGRDIESCAAPGSKQPFRTNVKRIHLSTGKALYRPPRSVTFWFNKTTSRWRLDLDDFRRAGGGGIYRRYARWDALGHVDNTVSHLNSDRVSVPSIERTCSVCERIVSEASVSRFRPRSALRLPRNQRDSYIDAGIWVKRMFTWVRGIAGGMRLAVLTLLEYRDVERDLVSRLPSKLTINSVPRWNIIVSRFRFILKIHLCTFTNALSHIHTRIYIHMPSGNTPTIYIHGKKGGKLANVEDNDDTVSYLYTFPVARSRTRAIVILRLRVHVGVPFRACIIPTVVARRRWLMRQKSTDSSPTSSHTWPLTSAVISAVGLRRSLREPPCVLQFFCGRG